jgi:hypothetical protein
LRGASVWESIGIEGAEVRVARLPAGEDPDSLVYGGQTAAFQLALDNAVPRVEFEIEQALGRHSPETEDGRSQALAEIVPILASVRSLTLRDKYVEKVAHLHPARRFNYRRAVDALLVDIDVYARQSDGARSPRDRGFPLTEQTNRAPLTHQPAPPSFRPPTAEGWGRWEPGTPSGYRSGQETRFVPPTVDQRFTRGGSGARYGKREMRDPLCDYSQPSLTPPALSGAEKAERQLLRALFTADWRSFVLGRLQPDLLITLQARDMFALAARLPAREDGSIDAAHVLRDATAMDDRRAEQAEIAAALDPASAQAHEWESTGEKPGMAAEEIFSSGAQEMHASAANSMHTVNRIDNSSEHLATAMSQRAVDTPISGANTAKTLDFIREVLEDSLSVMSNEPLSEAVLGDCILRLQRHHEEQTRRELMNLAGRDDLTPEQRQQYIRQYQEKMRQSRGSPPVVGDDND